MIHEIIDLLRTNNFARAGKYTELAKGKKELVTTWSDGWRKIKRAWQLKK